MVSFINILPIIVILCVIIFIIFQMRTLGNINLAIVVPILVISIIILILSFTTNVFGNNTVVAKWSNWVDSEEGKCTVECDGGMKKQTRICDPTSTSICIGESTQYIPCNTDPCSKSIWSEWSPISSSTCSTECGPGITTITRNCIPDQNGNQTCVGSDTMTVACNNGDCKKTPINGGWSNWLTPSSSSCSATCGNGNINQTRTCTNPAPQFGGTSCVGPTTQSIPCNNKDCPLPGQWTSFFLTNDCSQSCGGGNLMEKRLCLGSPDGLPCIGPETQESNIACNIQTCNLTTSECDSMIGPQIGGYPKECLNTWFQNAGCNNPDYIASLNASSFWNQQPPDVVKADMKTWTNASSLNKFSSICNPTTI